MKLVNASIRVLASVAAKMKSVKKENVVRTYVWVIRSPKETNSKIDMVKEHLMTVYNSTLQYISASTNTVTRSVNSATCWTLTAVKLVYALIRVWELNATNSKSV